MPHNLSGTYYAIYPQDQAASFYLIHNYLTAPVIPSANCFCSTKNTTIVGMEQNNTPHISNANVDRQPDHRLAINIGIVIALLSVMITFGHR